MFYSWSDYCQAVKKGTKNQQKTCLTIWSRPKGQIRKKTAFISQEKVTKTFLSVNTAGVNMEQALTFRRFQMSTSSGIDKKIKNILVSNWPSQSLDLSYWAAWNRLVKIGNIPTWLNENNVWNKVPPQQCKRLIASYHTWSATVGALH